jgi:hypothetical protein
MDVEITRVLNSNGFIVSEILINKIKLPLQLQNSIENKLKSRIKNTLTPKKLRTLMKL